MEGKGRLVTSNYKLQQKKKERGRKEQKKIKEKGRERKERRLKPGKKGQRHKLILYFSLFFKFKNPFINYNQR